MAGARKFEDLTADILSAALRAPQEYFRRQALYERLPLGAPAASKTASCGFVNPIGRRS